jgi:hypothetical protein
MAVEKRRGGVAPVAFSVRSDSHSYIVQKEYRGSLLVTGRKLIAGCYVTNEDCSEHVSLQKR